jgi:MFS family permease
VRSGSSNPWYVASVFGAFFVLSFLDRQIFAVLVTPIKTDLHLSDLQISYVGGVSFVIFYVLFGLPMGRLADVYNRKHILWFSVVLWTAATTACGLATRYWHLLVLRMGVGLGEAALAPCAFSMLADLFPRHRLATAVSICTAGAAVGLGMAYLGGAVVLRWAQQAAGPDGLLAVPVFGDLAPWRVVLIAVGIPGMLMSLLLLTIAEPARRHAGANPARTRERSVPLSEVLRYLRAHWTGFLSLFVGMGFVSLSVYACGFWDITFFERTYGVPPHVSGVYYGLLAVISQAIGNMIGGLSADYLTQKRSRDAKLLVLAVGALACIGFRLAYPMMPTFESALLLVTPAVILNSMPYGVAGAAVQIMAPARMRGQMTGLYNFVQNLIGFGFGPTSVALLTEGVFEDLNRVGLAIALVGAGAQAVAAAVFFAGLKPYQTTLAAAADADARSAG